MTSIFFTPQAERDLEEIGDFIALDNPPRALSFIREIRSRCAAIAESPLAWPARPELGKHLRSCAHGRHVIFFEPSERGITVIRILHGARDLPALFCDEP